MSSALFQSAMFLLNRLKEKGHAAYLVGGCVRSLLIDCHKVPTDLDIATSASSQDMAVLFPNSVMVGESFGVSIIRHNGYSFELATFRKEGEYSDGRHPDAITHGTFAEDSCRRDFTMNALYWTDNTITDLHNGLSDIAARVVRCVGIAQKRFSEDALRIVRMFRFATNLEFDIDPQALLAAQQASSGLNRLSRERFLIEFSKVTVGLFHKFVFKFTDVISVRHWLGISTVDLNPCYKNQSALHNLHVNYPGTALACTLLNSSAVCQVLKSWPLSRADQKLLSYFGRHSKEAIRPHSEFQTLMTLFKMLNNLDTVSIRLVFGLFKLRGWQGNVPLVDDFQTCGANLTVTLQGVDAAWDSYDVKSWVVGNQMPIQTVGQIMNSKKTIFYFCQLGMLPKSDLKKISSIELLWTYISQEP